MIQTIQLSVLQIEVMDTRLIQRNVMMVTQIVVMDVIVIEKVLKQDGCEEEDLKQHKIHENIEQQDIIKTIHSILNIVCLNVEMD